MGYKKTEEHKRKLSESLKGHFVSEETRKKQSEAAKGRIAWNKGTKGIMKPNKTSFTKGKNPNKTSFKNGGKPPKTAFKKGMTPWNKGKKGLQRAWNYIDGRSHLKAPMIYGDDWSKIRLLIYKRDKYCCQKCGLTMTEHAKKFKQGLHVHHKIPFRISKDNSLDNLITLCKSCHVKQEHKIFKEIKSGASTAQITKLIIKDY